jgi:hypothetical protein
MTTYLVTTELKTPWWLKLLRYFRLKKNRESFEIVLNWDKYSINDIIVATSSGEGLKVLAKRLQTKEEFIDNMIKESDNGN